MKLGLDELMIVNPGTPPGSASRPRFRGADYRSHRNFLGEDGRVYALRGDALSGLGSTDDGAAGFFLGDYGMLYQATPLG
jgi:hypothetical protein